MALKIYFYQLEILISLLKVSENFCQRLIGISWPPCTFRVDLVLNVRQGKQFIRSKLLSCSFIWISSIGGFICLFVSYTLNSVKDSRQVLLILHLKKVGSEPD